MSWKDDRQEAESVFERVREKYNPRWREQLRRHREMLHAGPETKGMGAKEIIRRAMLLSGIKPKEKRRFRKV